jgi:hypothetical protein
VRCVLAESVQLPITGQPPRCAIECATVILFFSSKDAVSRSEILEIEIASFAFSRSVKFRERQALLVFQYQKAAKMSRCVSSSVISEL